MKKNILLFVGSLLFGSFLYEIPILNKNITHFDIIVLTISYVMIQVLFSLYCGQTKNNIILLISLKIFYLKFKDYNWAYAFIVIGNLLFIQYALSSIPSILNILDQNDIHFNQLTTYYLSIYFTIAGYIVWLKKYNIRSGIVST